MRGSISGLWDHDPHRRWTLNRLSHPGAPVKAFLIPIFRSGKNLELVWDLLAQGLVSMWLLQRSWILIKHKLDQIGLPLNALGFPSCLKNKAKAISFAPSSPPPIISPFTQSHSSEDIILSHLCPEYLKSQPTSQPIPGPLILFCFSMALITF